MTSIIICGANAPAVGSRVPLRRQLHDNGFGFCAVYVTGLYGEQEERFWCSFSAYGRAVWDPQELLQRSLGWLERRIKTWDPIWPDAKWEVRLAWPYQSETWQRRKPGVWIVTAIGEGIA